MKVLKSHTALLIISNTITIIPYLYFLSLSKEQSLSAALAFALFYTFRMTGVFFLQTLTALFAPSLLAASVLIGGAGALVGILSTWWSVALLPAAGLLGISASWLPPADLMVRQKAKLTEQPLKNDWKEALFFLLFYCLPYGCLMTFKALAYLAVILHSLCWQLRVVKPSTTSQKDR